jgi:hypothetical protein
VSPGLQQQPHESNVVVVAGEEERGEAVSVLQIDVRPLFDEKLDNLQIIIRVINKLSTMR